MSKSGFNTDELHTRPQWSFYCPYCDDCEHLQHLIGLQLLDNAIDFQPSATGFNHSSSARFSGDEIAGIMHKLE